MNRRQMLRPKHPCLLDIPTQAYKLSPAPQAIACFMAGRQVISNLLLIRCL